MCNDLFVHHACGHREIIATPCELAQENPLWMKHLCPNYKGPLVKDGEYLDKVHTVLEQCKAGIVHLNSRLLVIKERATSFKEAADAANVPQQARKAHPAYQYIIGEYLNIQHERKIVDVEKLQAQKIITHAIKFLRRRKQWFDQHRGEGGIQPGLMLTLPEGLTRVPLELQPDVVAAPNPLFGVPLADPNVPLSQQASFQGQGPQRGGQTPIYISSREGSEVQITGVRRIAGNSLTGPTNAITAPTQQIVQQANKPYAHPRPSANITTSTQGTLRQATAAKKQARRKGPSPAKSVTFSEDGPGSVRRSKRARTKKISYAESLTSDASRASSPDKYDSPQKSVSELSKSPEPPSRRAKQRERTPEYEERYTSLKPTPNETLGGKIHDWKRRIQGTPDSSGRISAQQNDMAATQADVGKKRRREQSVENWNVRARSKRGGPISMPPPPMLGSPFPETSSNLAPVQRNLFTTYLHQNEDYGSLRSSFGTAHNLSPPKAAPVAVEDTEPEKRAQPESVEPAAELPSSVFGDSLLGGAWQPGQPLLMPDGTGGWSDLSFMLNEDGDIV